MKSLFLLCMGCLVLTAAASETMNLIPEGGVTGSTPSLETAYPGEVSIDRRVYEAQGLVYYDVRIFAPLVTDRKSTNSALAAVAIVVSDAKGTQLFSSPLEARGIAHGANQAEFRGFNFMVHESVEATTTINLGQHDGMRILYTKYRLPLKTIDHPKAKN